ncbi:MAG: M16 family metallopeptidase [Bacilli bacterium]
MIKNYPFIDEQVHIERLDNGLQIFFIPKKGFKHSFVFFATPYGAAMNRFIPHKQNDYWDAPLGIAHFLEHQLFTLPNNQDASELLAGLGLQSNALTNYNMTGYLFNGTNNILTGLSLLLDFVQTPHFNQKSVQKEQGIIAQELKMYLDRPGDALQNGLMQNMFWEYPLKHDIGGTLASIQNINSQNLRLCHRTFYHPSNMYLVVVGDLDRIFEREAHFDDLVDFIKTNQIKKRFTKPQLINVDYGFEKAEVKTKYGEKTMEVTVPKAAFGLKLPVEKLGYNESMVMELSLKILLEATFGPSTDHYQMMLDQELIQSGMGHDIYHDGQSGFIKISANTKKPEAFLKFVKEKMMSLSSFQLEEIIFERFKKAILGNFIKSLNSFEFLSIGYLEYLFRNGDLFDALQMCENLQVSDLAKVQKYFKEEMMTSYVIQPPKK